MKSGVLIVNKPAGMTSHDAVFRLRKLFQTKKAGHTGTLDPMATGVLPVLIGSAVKASEYLTAENKVYRASLRFGKAYDTEDVWGKAVAESEKRPGKEEFFRACLAFPAEYDQVPPMVSAIKVGGKKLYEYAREGIELPREARRVRVDRVEALSFSGEEAEIRVFCSKGTYIRTLIKDLCASLGCLGAMSTLCREKSGAFGLESAVTIAALERMTKEEREACVIPTEELFPDLPEIAPEGFALHLVENGQPLSCRKYFPSASFKPGRVRLYRKNAFFALGEISQQEEDLVLQKIKEFHD